MIKNLDDTQLSPEEIKKTMYQFAISADLANVPNPRVTHIMDESVDKNRYTCLYVIAEDDEQKPGVVGHIFVWVTIDTELMSMWGDVFRWTTSYAANLTIEEVEDESSGAD